MSRLRSYTRQSQVANLGADNAARDIAVFNSFLNQIDLGRASGAIPSGYMHLFLTDELATKTGAVYDATNNRYFASGSQVAVSQAAGTAIGDMTGGGGITAPYDGVTSQTNTQGAKHDGSGTVAYTGKDWGDGTPKVITGFDAYGSTDQGFIGGYNPTVTLTLVLSNTNDPATGTEIGSTSVTDQSAQVTVTKLDFNNSTPYRYAWVKISASGSIFYICCAEVVFYETPPANMDLISTAITAGAVPDAVNLNLILNDSVDVVLNTDIKARATRDDGSNWSDWVTLEEISDYDASYRMVKGTADLSALASGTGVKWELATYNLKAQSLRAVCATWE